MAIEPSANLGSQSRKGADGGLSGNGEGPWGPWHSDWAKWFLWLDPGPQALPPEKPRALGGSSWWLCRGLGQEH